MPATTSTRLLGPDDLLALGYCGQGRSEASSVNNYFDRTRHGRRAKTTPGMARLRELIYPHVHGVKTPVGVRPSVTKAVLMSMWNGGRIHSIPRIANYKLADHAEGDRTLYYWSPPDGRYLFPMIDIDIQKAGGKGTPEGGRAFARHLDENVLPGCHWEPSTNGDGTHGYPVIDLGPNHALVDARQRKEVLRGMQDDLVTVAEDVAAAIELVEVKGGPPVIDHAGRHHGRNTDLIANIVYGTFAKIPRDLDAVADLQPVDLGRLHEAAEEARARAAARPGDHTEAGRKAKRCGSCTGKIVTAEMLSIVPRLEEIAGAVMGDRVVRDSNGGVVTTYDLACCLLVSMVCGRWHPNAEGTMPTRRFSALWGSLHEAGDFKRAWSPNRWKACRDLLSSDGLVHWIDRTYLHLPDGGGRACVWRLVAGLEAMIDALLAEAVERSKQGRGEEEAPSVKTPLAEVMEAMPRTGQNLRPTRVWAVRRVPRLVKAYLHEYRLAA